MKYFTAEWHRGDLSDADCTAVQEAYSKEIATLRPHLPPALVTLVDTNLHDGRFRRVVFDHASKELTFELRCGDLQVGYFDLDLAYRGVDLDERRLSELIHLANGPRVEILYDEVGVEGESFVHRYLFWPYRELDIGFRALSLQATPVRNRDIPESSERVVQLNRPAR